MEEDNYALWLLETALRNEVNAKQQALQLLEGNEPHYNSKHFKETDVFRESLNLADKRIPELLDAIHQIKK